MSDSKIACDSARKDLLNCLQQSECYKVEGFTPRECLKMGEDMPDECKHIKHRMIRCKLSQVNARVRFRGKTE